MLGARVGDREGREVDARIAREPGVELAAERRVGGLEQHLDVAAREHRRDVAGAGELRRSARRIGIDLHGQRRRCEARAHERLRRGLRIAHEMADVVEEDLAAERQLPVGRGFRIRHRHGSQCGLGSEVRIILAASPAMRTSESKPHWINKLLVSVDSEVRKRTRRKIVRTSESGH